MTRTSLVARWVLPVTAAPIESGRVAIEDGAIVAVERAGARQPSDIDCGDAVILPGFVNAHTHLELTECRGRAPFAGSFVDWLSTVVMLQIAGGTEDVAQRAVEQGLRESLAVGVTAIADIGRSECAGAWGRYSGTVTGLLEVLGMGSRAGADHPRAIGRISALLDGASAQAEACGSSDRRSSGTDSLGISPHAPYSTAPQVYRDAIELVGRRRLPIGTHLAETREELEFIANGTGPFRRLLEAVGAWDGSFEVPGCSPVVYAERLGLLACRPILAHVNYVSDGDIAILAKYPCSVAYCPRTHWFFQHEPHRYRDMLAAGTNVCVGTDSLASNETLSVLDELRFLRRQDAAVSNQMLLEMGTIRGARAMGMESRIGSIEPGKRADLVVVEMTEPQSRDAMDDLLRGDGRVRSVCVRGVSALM